MRTYFVILVCIGLLFASSLANSQDRVDPRPLPDSLFADTSVYDFDFHRHHFIRGWNFGENQKSRKVDEALLMNYYLWGSTINAFDVDSNSYGKNHRRAYNYYYLFGGRGDSNVTFNGHSLYLKPYITVDTKL